MTFRRDSDIIDSFGPFAEKWDEKPKKQFYAYSEKATGQLYSTNKKSKMIYWAVSNCETPNKRENYVKELESGHLFKSKYAFNHTIA